MVSWLAPFAIVAVVAALYFAGDAGRRQGMLKDINFYMVCVVAVAIVSIIAGARYGTDWLDVGAWIAAAIAAAAALVRWSRGSGAA